MDKLIVRSSFSLLCQSTLEREQASGDKNMSNSIVLTSFALKCNIRRRKESGQVTVCTFVRVKQLSARRYSSYPDSKLIVICLPASHQSLSPNFAAFFNWLLAVDSTYKQMDEQDGYDFLYKVLLIGRDTFNTLSF